MSPEVSKTRSLMHVFFDLDGTLTDSREGIVRCIQYALQELGAFVPSDGELTRYLGPPLAGLGQRRHVMDHIAERRGFNEKHIGHRAFVQMVRVPYTRH